jgi:hypothetical protein
VAWGKFMEGLDGRSNATQFRGIVGIMCVYLVVHLHMSMNEL